MFYEEKFGNPGDDRNHLKNESAVPLEEYLLLGCQIVFTKNINLGTFLRENVGIFYRYLVFVTASDNLSYFM
jgi:hypothetical protein